MISYVIKGNRNELGHVLKYVGELSSSFGQQLLLLSLSLSHACSVSHSLRLRLKLSSSSLSHPPLPDANPLHKLTPTSDILPKNTGTNIGRVWQHA